MILDCNNPMWPYIVLHDGNGNTIINCFKYNMNTKEVFSYVEDQSFIKDENNPLIIGKILMKDGKPVTKIKVFPNSFITIEN